MTPKRYVGHIGLDTNPMAHSGPSRARAPFALTMSVRIFGHLSNFPLLLPAVHYVEPTRARRTHGPMDHM